MFGGIDRGGVRGSRRRIAARLPVAILALALCAALAGCGSAKPLTRAQLVRQANALCLQVQTKMKSAGTAKTAQDLARLADRLAGFEQHQMEAMRKLKPPAAMASDWKHVIEGAEEVAESAGTLSTEVKLNKKKAAAEALKHIGEVERRIAPIVKRDGFQSCSQL